MRPRFVGHLGLADVVTAANAAVGFCAVVAATVDPGLAARLVLLASIADGLDGLVARWRGGTDVGEHLDSLADVASFGVAPAALVSVVAVGTFGPTTAGGVLVTVGLPAAFVMMAVVRLGMYTAWDTGNAHTEGVPTTLAGTILAAAVLVGVPTEYLLVSIPAFTYLMIAEVTYPDLLPRDALLMGAVQFLAVVAPRRYGGLFPRALLLAALAYLVLSPRFYWR